MGKLAKAAMNSSIDHNKAPDNNMINASSPKDTLNTLKTDHALLMRYKRD